MRKPRRGRALVVAAGAAIALGAVPVSGYAAEADHCLEPPYTAQLVIYCGCVAVAGGLSPVIPPESWSCRRP